MARRGNQCPPRRSHRCRQTIKTEEALARDEKLLVDHAKHMRFDGFKRVVDYWAQRADPDGAEADDDDDRADRAVDLAESIHGMWFGKITLDPISGAIVAGELRRRELALFGAARQLTARLFKGATRRAVELRDRECTDPSCDRPAEECQVDHITPYSRGGPTTQANGRIGCGYHNRLWFNSGP